ncbi:MAG: fumarylacetoacetase [Arenicellales bacterium]|nr:fumarylacetoacetase [Arenicellales bacterium]
MTLNETHDPKLTSWVNSAQQVGTDFPIQNLPLAIFRSESTEPFRGGVAIGDQIVDLGAVAQAELFSGEAAAAVTACTKPSLNAFMNMGPGAWSSLRSTLSRGLREGSSLNEKLANCLVPQSEAEYAVPADIGDYTDFYTSIHHATNIGKLFRPDNPLMPNYQWVPIGYHGRSSSIQISGVDVRRPKGQTKAPDALTPSFGPCQRLDYEMEMGIFIGCGNEVGQPIPLDDSDNHIFGLCLLNDWSARDIQAWEYQPLGPFLSKSFATTISPWIVTWEALAPYRKEWTRPTDHPQPLPYLESNHNRSTGAFDIELEVLLETKQMRRNQEPPSQLSVSNFRYSYWTVAQMVAHHTINGCNLRPGDLFGSGTMSGPEPTEAGALIELTKGGKQPVTLTNGEHRTFLEDGDAVIMRGRCQHRNAPKIGFGEAVGTILSAT